MDQYKLSDLWDKAPNEVVERLAVGMGDGSAYGEPRGGDSPG